jgi:hypothetical protein
MYCTTYNATRAANAEHSLSSSLAVRAVYVITTLCSSFCKQSVAQAYAALWQRHCNQLLAVTFSTVIWSCELHANRATSTHSSAAAVSVSFKCCAGHSAL